MIFLIVSCVLFVFSGLIVGINPTFAVLPSGYDQTVNGEDWYFGEDFLNIAALKSTVDGWFEDDRVYDFSFLEEHPIVVAVIDTGVNYVHELFEGYYDENGNPVNDDGVGAYDVFYRDSDGEIICKNTVRESGHISMSILDDAPDMHGTHVTGIVATLIHALGLEKYIKIMPIKAAYPKGTKSSFSTEAVQAALAFAVDNGADVINMSLTSSSTAYSSLVTSTITSSAVVVAAAGNDAKSSEGLFATKYYPAANSNVIGVMNLKRDGTNYDVYSSSNYGNAYDLGAPGNGIWSANGESDDGYKTLNGTSMASPIVAFGAALATLKYSAIAKATGSQNAKTPTQIANIIRASYKSTVLYKTKIVKAFDMNVFAVDDGQYSVYINCDATKLSQKLGDVQSVSFEASLLPDNTENAALSSEIKWYLVSENGERAPVGEGKIFEYAPENAVGDYQIVAEYVGDVTLSSTRTITVEYVEPSKEDTKIDKAAVEDECLIGETYKLNVLDYGDYRPTDIVIWYVNGEYATGGAGVFEFEFTPESKGTYEITVKINGTVIDDSVVLEVGESKAKTEKVYTYVSIGVTAGVLLIVAICIIVTFARSKILVQDPTSREE